MLCFKINFQEFVFVAVGYLMQESRQEDNVTRLSMKRTLLVALDIYTSSFDTRQHHKEQKGNMYSS